MVAWWKPVLAVLASVGTLHAVVFHLFEDRINFFFMKLFRDVGRYKALKRRRTTTLNNKGLLAFLADSNSDNNNGVDPLRELLDLNAEQEDELHLPTYTRQELYDLGHYDTSPDGALLLGILGRVYDVTLGDRFYGPDATYGHFSGHDVTYALATGCKSMKCVQTDWTQLQTTNDDNNNNNNNRKSSSSPSTVFDDKQLLEAKKWLSFFHLHDKYPLVGKLEGDSFEALVQELLAQDDDEEEVEEEEKTDSNGPDDTKSEQEMLESITS